MKIYLCGGINSLSDNQAKGWREKAKEILHAIGHETLDPMRRDYRGKEDQNVDDIVLGDIDDIGASNWILVNAERPSWGTAMELVYAFMLRKHVVAFVGDAKPSPWLVYHSTFITKTIEKAIRIINVI
jgi:nucleoside 2-deoxyribosyltransferase